MKIDKKTHNNNSKRALQKRFDHSRINWEEMVEGGIDGWVENGQETNLY